MLYLLNLTFSLLIFFSVILNRFCVAIFAINLSYCLLYDLLMELLCLFNWYLCDSDGWSKGDFILRSFCSCYLNWRYWWHLSLHLLTLWPILLISGSFLSSNSIKFALLILHIPKDSICLCRSLYLLLLWGNLFVFIILRLS